MKACRYLAGTLRGASRGTEASLMLRIAATVCAVFSLFPGMAPAAVTFTGAVDPSDPLAWSADQSATVAGNSNGSIVVDDGNVLHARSVYVASPEGFTGEISVDGGGSRLTASRVFYLGYGGGEGSLTITNGGSVSVLSWLHVGIGPVATGRVSVDGVGSTLSAGEMWVGTSRGAGTLSISGGATATGYATRIGFNRARQGAVHVVGSGTTLVNAGPITLGEEGSYGTGGGVGALEVSSGATVQSGLGVIGFHENTVGVNTAIVDGIGTSWTTDGTMDVGVYGKGRLAITGGATVDCYWGRVGAYGRSGSGVAIVSGPDSVWACRNGIYVGEGDLQNAGDLSVFQGGLVKSIIRDRPADSPLLDIKADGMVKMGSGGMLALEGEAADSLDQFLELVDGTDDIRYRDLASGTWQHLSGAAYGTDYTLQYHDAGDLAGFTVLTVTAPIPEPAAVVLALLGMGCAWLTSYGRRATSPMSPIDGSYDRTRNE